jgi:hypothetical protein
METSMLTPAPERPTEFTRVMGSVAAALGRRGGGRYSHSMVPGGFEVTS